MLLRVVISVLSSTSASQLTITPSLPGATLAFLIATIGVETFFNFFKICGGQFKPQFCNRKKNTTDG